MNTNGCNFNKFHVKICSSEVIEKRIGENIVRVPKEKHFDNLSGVLWICKGMGGGNGGTTLTICVHLCCGEESGVRWHVGSLMIVGFRLVTLERL